MGENSTFELLWVGSCSGGWPTLVGGWPTHNTCLLCCVLASCGQPVVFWPLVANPGQKFAGVVHVVHLVSGWDFKLQLLWVAIANPGQNFAGRPLADDCCQLVLPVEPTFAHRPLITMRSLRDHHKSTVEIQKYSWEIHKYSWEIHKYSWEMEPNSAVWWSLFIEHESWSKARARALDWPNEHKLVLLLQWAELCV